jgi:hypothetical protein
VKARNNGASGAQRSEHCKEQEASSLESDQQRRIDRWGTVESFACGACRRESTNWGGILPTRVGMALVICGACTVKMATSPKYRCNVLSQTDRLAWFAVAQRVADLIGVTVDALVEASNQTHGRPGLTGQRTMDLLLDVPIGSIERALEYVLGSVDVPPQARI